MNEGRPDLSLVVPVLNEAGNLAALAAEIVRALDGAGLRWECVWVDDGSDDGTPCELGRVREADPRHRSVRLVRHQGQSAAIWAGFQRAAAPVLATMDGDGQNDPADLAVLFRHLVEHDLDMVVGIRSQRRDPRLRLWSSTVATLARRIVLGDTLHDAASPIRVFRRSCLRHVYPFRGVHRFLAILAQIDGFRVGQAPVGHRARMTGRSKYGVGNRLGVGLADLAAVAWMRRRGLRLGPSDVAADVTGAEGDRPGAER